MGLETAINQAYATVVVMFVQYYPKSNFDNNLQVSVWIDRDRKQETAANCHNNLFSCPVHTPILSINAPIAHEKGRNKKDLRSFDAV